MVPKGSMFSCQKNLCRLVNFDNKHLIASNMSQCNLVIESPLQNSYLRPYVMYVLRPKLGFMATFGNIILKLKRPSLGSMNS